jgi:hypothetical protein
VDECDTFCIEAQNRGFATISLQGIANGEGELRSWHGFGSTNSSTDYLKNAYDWTDVAGCDESAQAAENGRTCNLDAYAVQCYDDCNDECLDSCWWTTCQDSVAQTIGVLKNFMEQFCIDETMIWATGCSNGGMFLYELAHDERSASLLAGVAPMVGLPHYGFNFGPLYNMSFFGSWGLSDDVVPPKESASDLGCQLPCRTSESEGWFFTSSKCTTGKWAEVMELEKYEDVGDFGYIENEYCWSYSSSTVSTSGVVVEVVGCHFKGGHEGCNMDYQVSPMLDFMENHPKRDLTTPYPTKKPSKKPTKKPSKEPTRKPTKKPAVILTEEPTRRPTKKPTKKPKTKKPTRMPTKMPTDKPSEEQTKTPTKKPIIHTDEPTDFPTDPPFSSSLPSMAPSASKMKTDTLAPALSLTPAPVSEEKPSGGEEDKEKEKSTNMPTESGK